MSELKPCPFCGREAVLQSDIRYPRPKCEPQESYEVLRDNYDCVIYRADNRYFSSKRKAIEAWNRRAESQTTVIHAINLDGDSLFRCSNCGWSCSDTLTGDTENYNYCPNCGAKMDGKDEM